MILEAVGYESEGLGALRPVAVLFERAHLAVTDTVTPVKLPGSRKHPNPPKCLNRTPLTRYLSYLLSRPQPLRRRVRYLSLTYLVPRTD